MKPTEQRQDRLTTKWSSRNCFGRT